MTEAVALVRIPLTRAEIRARLQAPPAAEHFSGMSRDDAEWLVGRFCLEAGQTGHWQHLARHLMFFAAVLNRPPRPGRPGSTGAAGGARPGYAGAGGGDKPGSASAGGARRPG